MADWINKNESSITIRNKLNSLKIYVDNLKTNIEHTIANINTSIANLKTSDIKLSQNIASKTGLTVNATLDDALNYMMQSTTYGNYVLYKVNMVDNGGMIVANHPVTATVPNGTSYTYTSDNKGYFLFLYPREYTNITLDAGGANVIGYDHIPNIMLQPPAVGTYFREYNFSFVRVGGPKTITTSGNFTLAEYIQSFDVHLFGGGGAGSISNVYKTGNTNSYVWGGGGGGGCVPVLRENIIKSSDKLITINIGGGGITGAGYGGNSGGNTTFQMNSLGVLTSTGGSGGISYGGSGGSGGGGRAYATGTYGAWYSTRSFSGGSGGELGKNGNIGSGGSSGDYLPSTSTDIKPGDGIGHNPNLFRALGDPNGMICASGGGGGSCSWEDGYYVGRSSGGTGAGRGGSCGPSSSDNTSGENGQSWGSGGGGGGNSFKYPYERDQKPGGNGQQGAVFIRWR